VNTNECGLDIIAVIRELVSSLISRADGIRTSLSTLEESDVVEVGPEFESIRTVSVDNEIGSSAKINATPTPHPIESSDSKNLTYNELLSELILAKVNLASTSYDLLRAKYNTRKGFHPAPFGIPAAPRHFWGFTRSRNSRGPSLIKLPGLS
jgi:hypothetical protein